MGQQRLQNQQALKAVDMHEPAQRARYLGIYLTANRRLDDEWLGAPSDADFLAHEYTTSLF